MKDGVEFIFVYNYYNEQLLSIMKIINVLNYENIELAKAYSYSKVREKYEKLYGIEIFEYQAKLLGTITEDFINERFDVLVNLYEKALVLKNLNPNKFEELINNVKNIFKQDFKKHLIEVNKKSNFFISDLQINHYLDLVIIDIEKTIYNILYKEQEMDWRFEVVNECVKYFINTIDSKISKVLEDSNKKLDDMFFDSLDKIKDEYYKEFQERFIIKNNLVENSLKITKEEIDFHSNQLVNKLFMDLLNKFK